MRRAAIAMMVLVVATVGYAATGWVSVAPGEVVVVRRLGRVLPRPWGPGPHLGAPLGFDRITRVRTDEVRRLAIGLRDIPGADDEPGAGEYLSGDLNLLRAQAIVQYRVADPVAYALRAGVVEPLLTRMIEASLTRALSRRGIDGALGDERAAIALDVEHELARPDAAARLGIAILGVSLTHARPPSEVAADFAAAQAARSERDRRINEAKTYATTLLPAAKSSALARTEQARSRAERAVTLARSRAGRFLALLAEADRARPLTVRRLYLDALRDLLPRVRRKLLLTPDEMVDLSLLGVEPVSPPGPPAPEKP